jgi:Four helix bundle sensory module for signal transduction
MRAAGTKRALRLAFTMLILVGLSIQALHYFNTRSIDRDVDLVFGNSLESIRLLGRIGLQVERFRILLDRHVMEQESQQMSLLDAQIATARKQFNDSAREFETLPWYPGEQHVWERLKGDLAAVDESVPAILADSR